VRQYTLVTHWNLGAPVERIWDALVAAEDWPKWWRYVQAVVPVEKGDAQGIGAIRRYTWSSRLPYRLSFEMRTTALTRPAFIEGVAAGDLNGTGRWRLSPLGTNARVRYEWTVTTGKGWMNVLAPLLAPVFAWNHDQVMHEGGHGIARHLGIALLAYEGSKRNAPDNDRTR
jgi:uncharacterized protein YndB with AHSA1/START domain